MNLVEILVECLLLLQQELAQKRAEAEIVTLKKVENRTAMQTAVLDTLVEVMDAGGQELVDSCPDSFWGLGASKNPKNMPKFLYKGFEKMILRVARSVDQLAARRLRSDTFKRLVATQVRELARQLDIKKEKALTKSAIPWRQYVMDNVLRIKTKTTVHLFSYNHWLPFLPGSEDQAASGDVHDLARTKLKLKEPRHRIFNDCFRCLVMNQLIGRAGSRVGQPYSGSASRGR